MQRFKRCCCDICKKIAINMKVEDKKMKLKKCLVVCGLSLVVALCGCGATAPGENKSGITGEILEQEQKEDDSEEVTKKITEVIEASGEDTQEVTEQAESEEVETKDVAGNSALEAYKEILKAAPALEGEHEEIYDATFDYGQNVEKFGKHYDSFAVKDINQDGTPELITLSVINFRWTMVSIYTLEAGEAVLVKNSQGVGTEGSFDQMSTANGAYVAYICEENHIHSVWRGTDPMGEEIEENTAYAVSGTSLTVVDCTAQETEGTISIYDIMKENVPENVDTLAE